MGSVLPKKGVDLIEFLETRGPVWNERASQIGTTVTEVGVVQTRSTAAREALSAQQAAQAAARAATLTLRDALRDLRDAAADVVKQIKARAAIVGDHSVYALAEIPAPALPSPLPPPGKATDFRAGLEDNGALSLSWKAINPRGAVGTVYQISRQVGTGPFVFIGSSGIKKFTDETLPLGAGSGPVTYRIVAVRSTARGPVAEFAVKFGIGGGGQMIATVTQPEPKVAA